MMNDDDGGGLHIDGGGKVRVVELTLPLIKMRGL